MIQRPSQRWRCTASRRCGTGEWSWFDLKEGCMREKEALLLQASLLDPEIASRPARQ